MSEESHARRRMVTIDGNTAAAHVAHATNEICAIYPITPSSNMGELADAKSARGEKNIWGTVPIVTELQSEGGASGAVHGALTAGALTTTFTASQGLLLMIPNMYKIAGELTPTVFHVSARAVATHALSIFGDHSDVMACRQTGWAMIASGSVQEVMDFALIAQAATLSTRIPFLHFFDGFRTSHEVQKVYELSMEEMRAMIDEKLVSEHRARGLNPDRPVLRGSAQNPDVFFQGREAANKFYLEAPAKIEKEMEKFARITGRRYNLFDYYGAPDAERIIVIMGSGAETVHEVVEDLTKKGEKVGVIKVRIYRPFSVPHFIKAIPSTVKAIAVLDRTKEPGAIGEPLYTDVRAAVAEALANKTAPFKRAPKIVGGRYGLGSKEFDPCQVKAVFDNLKKARPVNHFTVGINDDVTGTSLKVDPCYTSTPEGIWSGKFYGLGSDGTVGANKNSIKIIGDLTDYNAQGYFVYDSKKAGAMTVSHLRFGKPQIRSPYLVTRPDFVAVHKFTFLEVFDVLEGIKEGGTFLLNTTWSKDEVWDKLPRNIQKTIIDKKLKFYVINAQKIAEELNLGVRINTTMQAAFFKIAGIIKLEDAIKAMKDAVIKTYGRKGEKIVKMNLDAIDRGVQDVHLVSYPNEVTSKIKIQTPNFDNAPEFIKNVYSRIRVAKGDEVPVSAMPVDGTFPTATSQYEKRNIADNIPVWEENLCVQCGVCSFVCPHAAIRMKIYDPENLKNAPKTFKHTVARGLKDRTKEWRWTVQVAPEDCTGCGACVHSCLGREKDQTGKETGRRAINMAPQEPLRAQERINYEFFLSLPETPSELFERFSVKGSQLIRPLFEYSGACAGCGETPYVKLLTQLYGDRLMIANATGCSSIYGGNLPTTPYAKRADGRGPAWSNSLFEDNAEFGYGMRLAVDIFKTQALELARSFISQNGPARDILEKLLAVDQRTQEGIETARAYVAQAVQILERAGNKDATRLAELLPYIVERAVWVIGGDGWAYDIGFGGLDHVMASGKNVKALVLDTEVYSNTGGQCSKSTPLGATAQFAAGGKATPKKDMAMIFMSYQNIYVAKVAFGADRNQTVRAFKEAMAYNGPAIILAYSHCIAHGIDMMKGVEEQKKAVASGHWPLLRYNPDLAREGKNPLILDSQEPSIGIDEFAYGEIRWNTLLKSKPDIARQLMEMAKADIKSRWRLLKYLAAMDYSTLSDSNIQSGSAANSQTK